MIEPTEEIDEVFLVCLRHVGSSLASKNKFRVCLYPKQYPCRFSGQRGGVACFAASRGIRRVICIGQSLPLSGMAAPFR
jgi:hypothetical protein